MKGISFVVSFPAKSRAVTLRRESPGRMSIVPQPHEPGGVIDVIMGEEPCPDHALSFLHLEGIEGEPRDLRPVEGEAHAVRRQGPAEAYVLPQIVDLGEDLARPGFITRPGESGQLWSPTTRRMRRITGGCLSARGGRNERGLIVEPASSS